MENKVDYATNIALIKNGVVKKIIWGMFYGKESYERWGYKAVEYGALDVRVGHTYNERDKCFYDENGDVVVSERENFNRQIEELDNYIIELAYEDIIGDVD